MFSSFLWRVIDAYQLLIIASAVMSWFPKTPGSVPDQIERGVRGVTDPFVNLFRRLIPPLGAAGMAVDFSPVVAIVVLGLLKRIL